MANRLPEYYIVFADLKNPLWKEYVKHINTLDSRYCYAGDSISFWYGFDGHPNYYRDKDNFLNNPVELSLEEFFDLKKELEVSAIRVTSTHKETVKSVAVHIEIEGEENIKALYTTICLVQGTLNKEYAGRVIELLEGIKSQLKA